MGALPWVPLGRLWLVAAPTVVNPRGGCPLRGLISDRGPPFAQQRGALLLAAASGVPTPDWGGEGGLVLSNLLTHAGAILPFTWRSAPCPLRHCPRAPPQHSPTALRSVDSNWNNAREQGCGRYGTARLVGPSPPVGQLRSNATLPHRPHTHDSEPIPAGVTSVHSALLPSVSQQ